MLEFCAVAQLGQSPFFWSSSLNSQVVSLTSPISLPSLEIMLKDYYAILGVAEDASPAEIKLQYQKLLLIVMSHFSFRFLCNTVDPSFFVLTFAYLLFNSTTRTSSSKSSRDICSLMS